MEPDSTRQTFVEGDSDFAISLCALTSTIPQ